MSSLFIIALISILNLLLGSLILARNPHSRVNRLFFIFTVSLIFWSFMNFVADYAATDNLLYTRLTFIGGISIGYALIMFSAVFPDGNSTLTKRFVRIQTLLALMIAIASLTPFMVEGVIKPTNSNRIEELITGPLYYVYIIYILQALYFSVINLRKRLTSTVHRHVAQVKLLITGVVVYASLAILLNLIIPIIVNNWVSSQYGPFTTLIFIGFMAYAIAKHKFFDVRLIVARSLGYVLAVGLLVTIFSITSSLLVQNLATEGGAVALAMNTAIFTLGILLYPSLKNFFDKSTRTIFYRDAYDPQVFLDELNKHIVSNIEIGILLRRTTAIIQQNLKSDFVQIAIRDNTNDTLRIIGTKDFNYKEDEMLQIRKVLSMNHSRVIIADDLTPSQLQLSSILNNYNISIISQLTAAYYGEEQSVAYLVLGNKKSGNMYTKDDLRILEIISDELVIAIQNALRFEEIQDFNVTLQKKVNDATGKLKRTNDKLKAMDETKDEFISMASHQLRTPLTSVKGYLSMVLEGDAGDLTDAQRKLLDQAYVSSQRMVYLIADLLNVSRLKTGKFVIDAYPTDLSEVIEGEVQQLTEQAKLKKLSLSYKKPKNFPQLMLDETKVRQVIMNFVDNAMYYTPAGGKINVELKEDKSHVYFMVKDNGLGVPKEEQKHLFMKFYRAKNARKARPDGTGLGLFMAKKVITAQGGNILFESEEGKGSMFGFSFRKKHLEPPKKA